jgi:hypothetical protein
MITHADLTAWAGAENVHRATPSAVAEWDVPTDARHVLMHVGIPITEQVVTDVAYQTGPAPQLAAADGQSFYQLTRTDQPAAPNIWHAFGIKPITGEVFYIVPGEGPRFTNTSVQLWIQSLHHFGSHLSRSQALQHWDDSEQAEEAALTELRALADDLSKIDPAAFAGYEDFTWPALLDRWLW